MCPRSILQHTGLYRSQVCTTVHYWKISLSQQYTKEHYKTFTRIFSAFSNVFTIHQFQGLERYLQKVRSLRNFNRLSTLKPRHLKILNSNAPTHHVRKIHKTKSTLKQCHQTRYSKSLPNATSKTYVKPKVRNNTGPVRHWTDCPCMQRRRKTQSWENAKVTFAEGVKLKMTYKSSQRWYHGQKQRTPDVSNDINTTTSAFASFSKEEKLKSLLWLQVRKRL